MSLALAGRFLTTAPPGNSEGTQFFKEQNNFFNDSKKKRFVVLIQGHSYPEAAPFKERDSHKSERFSGGQGFMSERALFFQPPLFPCALTILP